MKKIFLILTYLFSLNVIADVSVDVLSAEYPLEDHLNRKSLCLTVVRVPSSGALLGVVEDITDCFYARAAKKAPNHKIRLSLNKLSKIQDQKLREHLQRIDTQLEFYFSEGE